MQIEIDQRRENYHFQAMDVNWDKSCEEMKIDQEKKRKREIEGRTWLLSSQWVTHSAARFHSDCVLFSNTKAWPSFLFLCFGPNQLIVGPLIYKQKKLGLPTKTLQNLK